MPSFETIALILVCIHLVIALVMGLVVSLNQSIPIKICLLVFAGLLLWILGPFEIPEIGDTPQYVVAASVLGVTIILGMYFLSIGIVELHKVLRLKYKLLPLLQFASPILLIIVIYTAMFPSSRFYIKDFERNSGYTLPKEVEVLRKSASYPDIHGDYSSEAIIRLNKDDYLELLDALPPDDRQDACFFSGEVVYLGVHYKVGGCWTKNIKSDARIMVTYFPEEYSLHFFFSQN